MPLTCTLTLTTSRRVTRHGRPTLYGIRVPYHLERRWMTQPYEVCMRDLREVLHNQLGTRSFKDHVDYVPYCQFNHAGKRAWSNLMLGDWAWKQATEITLNPDNHGCAFMPIVAGSDKTTSTSFTVATGHQEYHPVYASPGILSGPACRAHGNSVLAVAYLAIPKVSKKHRSKPEYQRLCWQMYHTSLALVFEPLKQYMDTPDIIIIGPYIADYPEQVWLAAIVQNWCPKCDAYPDRLDAAGARLRNKTKTEVLIECFDPGILWDDYGLRSDIVLIKGTFKDHLVTWVNEYLHLTYSEKRALEIIQDIDHRISAVPEFPSLRRFPDGRDFSPWMGDDSKALIKIYLAAVAGYLPSDMIKCLAAFIDFCYTVCRNCITTDDFPRLKSKLARFHQYRAAFVDCGLRTDISLPRQHSLVHYIPSIILFGSPNGLCSSITESKHIKAVKEPWRRSSRYKALAQMLVTLTRLDKLAALRMTLKLRGIADGEQPQLAAAAPPPNDEDDDNNDGTVHGPKLPSDIELSHTLQRGYPHMLLELAAHIHHPQLPHIQLNPNWHGYARRDTILIDVGSPTMGGLVIGRVHLFFSFVFAERSYEYAPDPDTGMWVVEPERDRGVLMLAIINLDTVARAAHLLPVYGTGALPENFHFSDALDVFDHYFVNPYADHHMHELLSID
ncbi:hypothetical protein K438DRAFT_1914649 [Mycena galopus ATCC 62051]|nr:hypothetical protein K438DRAFT_1914649 [Mycena galopus ATCC 62051]